LTKDALVLAKQKGFDVFNALDIMDNMPIMKELKFGQGDGNLHYYLYNWRIPELDPSNIGVILV
jgi:glycylpeptide N-tetradecanoyltransferase